ncbi:MAG: hypothetical protein QXX64_06410 [Nitrososphaera sp.]|nr:hypothetical protein [Candidatus Nitrososphaera gargensis]
MTSDKPSQKQTAPTSSEEDKPTLKDYKSEEEPSKRKMKPKEASDVED